MFFFLGVIMIRIIYFVNRYLKIMSANNQPIRKSQQLYFHNEFIYFTDIFSSLFSLI